MIELVIRIGFSLLVIIGLVWMLSRAMRGPLGGRGSGPLAVLNRQQLSRGAAVTVVRVADRALVLGVTEQRISLLGETDLDAFEPEPPEHRDAVPVGPDALPGAHPVTPPGRLDGSLLSPRTWRSTLEFLRDRTTRQ